MPSPFTVLLLLLSGGLLLLIVGLWGKRVGTEPRCRKCRYNLTGLTANRCPECGTEIDAEAVRYGLRRRRWPALVFGSGLLLLSAAGVGALLYGRAQKIDWYQHYPVRLLLAYAGADDQAALDELLTRLEKDQIAAGSIPRLAELALEMHERYPPPPHVRTWHQLSEALYHFDFYTEAQLERFYRNLTTAHLHVRPRLRAGDPIIGRLEFPGEIGWRVYGTFQQQQMLLDGQSCQALQSYLLNSEITPRESGYSIYPNGLKFNLEPGRHTLTYQASCTVEQYADPFTSDERPVKWRGQTSATAQIEVVPLSAADPIRLIPDASVEEQLRGTLTIPSALLTRKYPEYDLLGTKFELHRPVELDLAFEVLLLSGEKEVRLGYIAWPRGEHDPIILPPHSSPETESELLGSKIDLLLRTSRTAAAQSLNCYEIWDGELHLDSVPIERIR